MLTWLAGSPLRWLAISSYSLSTPLSSRSDQDEDDDDHVLCYDDNDDDGHVDDRVDDEKTPKITLQDTLGMHCTQDDRLLVAER